MVPAVAIVLAAGQGTRMRSPLPKVLHRVGGRTMIDRVLDILERAGVEELVVVVGFGRPAVEAELAATHPRARVAVQEEQRGTGHAVRCALPLLPEDEAAVGIFSGDTPLLRPGTVHRLAGEHARRGAAATLLTAEMDDPTGYGRVLRGTDGLVTRIVEQKDASPAELRVREINAGAYVFVQDALRESLGRLRDDNAQGEYYLTDTIALLRADGRPVAALVAEGSAFEVLGVNTLEQLLQAEAHLHERRQESA